MAEIGGTPRPTIEEGSSLCEIGWGRCPRGILTNNGTWSPQEFVCKEVTNGKNGLLIVYTSWIVRETMTAH